jgi:hypothetical protein
MKKQVHTLVVSVIFVLAVFPLRSKENSRFTALQVSTINNKSELGTYQIQMVNSRLQPYIPGDIDEIVRKNRKKNERVYVKLDNNIRIMILSESEISSPNFKPLKQIEHVEE